MVSDLPQIPGLISIDTEDLAGGGTRLIFEIDDQQVEQFFESLGIPTGDVEALTGVIIQGLEWALKQQAALDEG